MQGTEKKGLFAIKRHPVQLQQWNSKKSISSINDCDDFRRSGHHKHLKIANQLRQ